MNNLPCQSISNSLLDQLLTPSNPTFYGMCPEVSYHPSSLSPTEMLTDDIIRDIIDLINFLDKKHLPHDVIHVVGSHKDSKGTMGVEG